MCASVEDLRDRLEALLTCSIPDLQLNNFVLDSQNERSELYSNCELVVLLEFVLSNAREQTGLSDRYDGMRIPPEWKEV